MSLRTAAAAVFMLCALPASAETRTFLVDGSDGYGIDRCLAEGGRCGTVAATAYCKSREFAQALSFRKVDKDEITGAIPVNSGACGAGNCEQFVAIECTR